MDYELLDECAGKKLGCAECARGESLGFKIDMAFQPIVRHSDQSVFAQEALVRGINNEPAGFIFDQVNAHNLYRFDQSCRVKAIQRAAELDIQSYLSINFMPNAVYRPELCIRTTLAAAEHYQFPAERIIFEITEGEKVPNHEHLRNIVSQYRDLGFKVALDDFGAGYSSLNLLADMTVDILKLDMALIRDIHQCDTRQAIVKSMVQMCQDLGVTLITEGIESEEELLCLQSFGIDLFQGYYFAKPSFRSLANLGNF